MEIIHSKNYSIRKKLFKKIFIQKILKLFIQKNYSFFWKNDYRPGLKTSHLSLTWLLMLFGNHPNPSGWTRSAILTDKGFWLLLSSSLSGIWSQALFLERLGTSSKFSIFYMLNLFSGTPWLLDVLNGFIAHNNVSRIII